MEKSLYFWFHDFLSSEQRAFMDTDSMRCRKVIINALDESLSKVNH